MITTWFDHLLFAILLLVLPLEALRWWRRFAADPERPGARAGAYRSVLIQHWTLTFGLFAVWAVHERSTQTLGLRWPEGWQGAATVGLVAVATLLFFLQRRGIVRDPATRNQLRGQFGELAALTPRGAGERRLANAAAVTAGLCEEILYRGFLIAYLGQFLPSVVAIPLACVAFGLAHTYQGLAGIAKTALYGAAMTAAYLVTGSLVAPIVLHAVTDLDVLWILRTLDRTRESDEAAGAAPAPGAAAAGGA